MATNTTVETIDDLTGETGASTVQFGLDGKQYEIDLTEANATDLRSFLQRYADVARQVGKGKSARKPGKPDRNRATAVRTWAREQGYDVGERGRIPSNVTQAYDAAHPIAA